MKKQLAALILSYLISGVMPLGAAADCNGKKIGGKYISYIAPAPIDGPRVEIVVTVVQVSDECSPIPPGVVKVVFSVEPADATWESGRNGYTDSYGNAVNILTLGSASSYTVTATLGNGESDSTTVPGRSTSAPPPSSGGTSPPSSGTTPPSSDTASLPTPSKLVKISGDNQTGLTNGVLANPFVVKVLDQYDAPLEGTPVTFTVVTGDGTLSVGTATTDASGQASSTLHLGTEAGTHMVEVGAEDISETVTFTAEAIPPTLTSVSGDNQSAGTGTALANPFVVEVRDGNDNPLAGVAVTFTITTGDGSLSDTSVDTNAAGRAESTLTLGEPGAHTVEVRAEGISETVTFTAEAIPPTLMSVLGNDQIGAAGTALANPFVVAVHDGNGKPLPGVLVTFVIVTEDGTLTNLIATTDAKGEAKSTLTLGAEAGAYTVEVRAEGISEIVTFTAVAELLEFDLSLSAGFNLIHLPLKVRVVDGTPTTIQSVADLYDVLGGADTVNWLITRNPPTQSWAAYFGDADRDTIADRGLTDQTGILASMRVPVSVRLGGSPLGTNGTSTIALTPGLNVIGLPLRDSRINRVSDLLTLEGIDGNVLMIIVTDNGDFKTVSRVSDPGDIVITGGQSFVLITQRAATVGISGEGWSNTLGSALAAPVAIAGIQVGNTTPVLALRSSIVDSGTGLKMEGLGVTVKNLSTGKAATAVPAPDETGYRHIIVDIETGRAATVGDILEISAQSPHPLIGVKPLQYTVTAEDVKRSLIQLPALGAYEIPAETELLANYPNPFNPETWIPYRLAEDAFITLSIYDRNGHIVRTLDVGYQTAAAYEDRSKAIYWDGKNEFGEQVASGIYFYHLSAGHSGPSVSHRSDFSATRKMVILK